MIGRHWLLAPTLALALLTAQSANATLRASVDNPQVAAGESVRLTLAHDGQTSSRPDLTPLKQNFDIVGTSSSTSVQIANGHVSAVTQLEVSLAPRRSGPLVIPSVIWDQDRSPILTVNVSAGGSSGTNSNAAGAAAAGSRVLLETEVTPKSPYVQAAVQVTARVYAAVPLSHADLSFPDTNDALVRQAGQDATTTAEKNGQTYQVVTRHYLVFPQHSGNITLQGPVLSGSVPDRSRGMGGSDPFSDVFGNSPFGSVFGSTKPIRLHSDPIVLDVQPRPAGAGASYWLPARTVSLQAHWNPSSLQARVGDPITLSVKLQAEGLTAAQLPDLSTLLNAPSGLKAYPDQASLKDEPHGADITASREQNIALIADQAGHFTIAELRLSWWDTLTNQPREVVLPAQSLNIQPAPGATNTVQTPAQSSQPNNAATPAPAPAANDNAIGPLPSARETTWQWISAALGVLWLATLIAWLTSRRGAPRKAATGEPPATTSQSELRSAFQAACRANDAPAARKTLLQWANAVWQGPPIRGLNALAKLLANSELTRLLEALDRACYAQDAWQGEPLAKSLSTLPLPKHPPTANKSELAPLYH